MDLINSMLYDEFDTSEPGESIHSYYLRFAKLINDMNMIPMSMLLERISKKRTKNEAKTTKPDTEWKSVEKTKSRQSPSLKKSTKVNPDKSKVKK
ncbi:hypothetical protein Tco_1153219 [Tanacetum coccineum]